jgi:phosphatidylserine decarboxylase
MQHQFVDRQTGKVCTERLYADEIVGVLYSSVRENAPIMFRTLTSARLSRLLAYVNYDSPLSTRLPENRHFLRHLEVDLSECLEPATLNSARKIFERKIRYWKCRPLPEDPAIVVAPADARMLVGALPKQPALALKGKFFEYQELLGCHKRSWLNAFARGSYAISRLTPEKYHYNHMPVAGRVLDFYEIDGSYHSCNPGAVVACVTPYSKNRRVITIIDTDVKGGTGAGLVAVIEVVALMIGDIVQVYSDTGYEKARALAQGMFVRRGAPKSLFRPGSSTNVLLFQKGRIRFDDDLIGNMRNRKAESRFSSGFGISLVETDVRVRSSIGRAVRQR